MVIIDKSSNVMGGDGDGDGVVSNNNDNRMGEYHVDSSSSSSSRHEDKEGRMIEEGDDGEMDDDQLLEYREMLDLLGNFADKVLINTLSMIAEDFSEKPKSCRAIYKCIVDLLLLSSSTKKNNGKQLPLVYVIDSILKNVGSTKSSHNNNYYVQFMMEDAKEWLSSVHQSLSSSSSSSSSGDDCARLKKVWNTWKEFHIFENNERAWTEMGQCFFVTQQEEEQQQQHGFSLKADGTLDLPSTALRTEMQLILDEMQQDVENELEKVSLERLAMLNPDLLTNIQNTAQDILSNRHNNNHNNNSHGMDDIHETNSHHSAIHKNSSSSNNNKSNHNDIASSIFTEYRPPHVVERAVEWTKIENVPKQALDLVSQLQNAVRSCTEVHYYYQESRDVTNLLAAASATASHMTDMLTRHKFQQSHNGIYPGADMLYSTLLSSSSAKRYYGKDVDKSKFTTEGLKEKNESVIARLYDAGLPFLSSSDGRRFASQLELSKHLDELFRKSQLEKTMERTEERGWYIHNWSNNNNNNSKQTFQDGNHHNGILQRNGNHAADAEENPNNNEMYDDPKKCTVPADDSRDRCAICGVNFNMFFDQEDGEWKYNHCREISVKNQIMMNNNLLYVHVKCWRSLGSPDALTTDQVRY